MNIVSGGANAARRISSSCWIIQSLRNRDAAAAVLKGPNMRRISALSSWIQCLSPESPFTNRHSLQRATFVSLPSTCRPPAPLLLERAHYDDSSIWNIDRPTFQRYFSTNTNDNTTTTANAVTVDFFGLFGLPRIVRIDLAELKQTYLKLMIEHHPDKQLHKDPSQEEEDQITAETITHAYQTLQLPHTRAMHWLELHGCPLVEEDSPIRDATNLSQNLVGMEFLMEIMEWRESIEDAGTDQSKLKEIASKTQALHSECQANIEELLDGVNDGVDGTETLNDATLQGARELTAQLQYWHRLETTLKEAMEVK